MDTYILLGPIHIHTNFIDHLLGLIRINRILTTNYCRVYNKLILKSNLITMISIYLTMIVQNCVPVKVGLKTSIYLLNFNFKQKQVRLYFNIINVCFLGKYWIDPNGGVPNDAVLVFCDFETLSSCILPKIPKVGH